MFEAKKRLRWSKIKVGLVITLALFALLVAVFFAGNIQNIFLKQIELKIHFKDVVGLRKGAPVWILGIEEGSVKNITLDRTYGVIVTVAISRNALQYLKNDSSANILTMGLLGDKYVELSTGSPAAEPMPPGEMIKGSSEVGLREVMNQFIERIDSLVTRIEKGEGTIAKLLNDPTLYDNLIGATHRLSALMEDVKNSRGTLKLLLEDPSVYENLKKTTQTLSVMSEEIKNSRGTLKLLLEDPSVYNKMSAAASSLEEFSRRINESSGTLKNLIEDPSLYNKALAAASQIEEFSRKLNEAQGTLRRMVEDPALYENFNRDLKELSSILEKIDKGEGVAGALIRDEELAKELKRTIMEFEGLLKDIKDHPKKYFKFSIF